MKKNALKVKTPPQFTKNYLSDSAREIILQCKYILAQYQNSRVSFVKR